MKKKWGTVNRSVMRWMAVSDTSYLGQTLRQDSSVELYRDQQGDYGEEYKNRWEEIE